MARIIPGVEVRVIKEVVPPQLAPAGVLGLVGLVGDGPSNRKRVERISNWGRFRELYGTATARTMPEAQQALQNGVREIVVVSVDSSTAAAAKASIPDGSNKWLDFRARVAGTGLNGITIALHPRKFNGEVKYEVSILDGDTVLEVHRDLKLNSQGVQTSFAERGSIVAVEVVAVPTTMPEQDASVSLANGTDAGEQAYINALDLLDDEPDVDLVIASLQDLTATRAARVYGAVISHCQRLSADAKGRMGFGQVPPNSTNDANTELVGTLVSDRFTLFAPYGYLGAAVGRIASLEYYESPTFKVLSGLGKLEPALRVVDQRALLTRSIVPLVELQGHGNVVLRGLTTDGDQINVRRVADRAVRAVKQIGERFIGKLNTEDGRNALKQKITEFMLQMVADSAIVPSTDGSDPAFKLDVYSNQADFAKGIVRVDLALRPVRAIDFIYATVLVQV